jgi:hypothetical protein
MIARSAQDKKNLKFILRMQAKSHVRSSTKMGF